MKNTDIAVVHVANTDVEFELASFSSRSLQKSWIGSFVFLQLQFLPLLYAQAGEFVAVSHFPDNFYLDKLSNHPWFQNTLPHLTLLSDPQLPPSSICKPWGHSPQIQAWALKNHLHYPFPSPWSMVQKVHSKSFSFQFSPLPQSSLIRNEKELHNWLKKNSGPKVLKTCFGLSGQGHYRLIEELVSPLLLKFCHKEWSANRPLIGEPWVERLEDFSSQWFIHPSQEIEWLGFTRFETDSEGKYLGTWAGGELSFSPSLKKYLQEHKQKAYQTLQVLAQLNYFGPVGIDALIYRQNGQVLLYPVVEINPRQTMSSLALCLQNRLAPQKTLHLSFSSHLSSFSLLPTHLVDEKGKIFRFKKNLTIEIK